MYYSLIACIPVTWQNYGISALHGGFCCSSGWTSTPHFRSWAPSYWDSEDTTGCWGECEPPGEGGKNKAIYVDVDACGYHSLSSMNTRHFTYFLEKLSVTNFECLSRHTLKASTKQSHKLLIQSCLSPWYVESLCLSRPQVGVLCFMEQRKVTLGWWNIWSRLEQTSTHAQTPFSIPSKVWAQD